MRIIIAGAGEVGFHVARMLSHEDHDIVLIDSDAEHLQHAESHMDVGAIKGNALSVRLLEEAGVSHADLFIAATSSEETNITTAIIAKHLGVKRTIARISNPEFNTTEKVDLKALGIDSMVFPEALAADEIHRLIQMSALTDIFEFEGGKLTLTGLFLGEDAPLEGLSMIEAVDTNPKVKFTVVAIHRNNNKTIIPNGKTVFKSGDHAFFISGPDCIDELQLMAGKKPVEIKRIMVLGGGLLAREFTKRVQDSYQVKLIEANRDRCFDLADELAHTMVINGDGSNVEFLEEEGIVDMDAFVALTGNSETNIISCLVAKNHGVARTIALVENIDYISLSQNIGIDTLINKKMITINNIFRHVREGDVEALTSLHGVESEILEFIVHSNCRIANIPIKKLKFPKDAVIAGVIRGETAFIARGDSYIQENDRVVVFTLPSAVHKVEKFFK